MAKGISIPVAVDTRDSASKIKAGITDPFEKADEVIKKLGDGNGIHDLTEDMKKSQTATKDTAEEVQSLKSRLKELDSTTESTASSGGTHLSKEFKRGAKEAGEGLSELRESAKQNSVETAASFDGSAQSIAAGFQSVASEALAGFGPLGLAAGLALATGLGFVQTQLSNIGATAAEVTQRIKDRTDDLIDNKSLAASNDFLAESIKTILEDKDKLNDVTAKQHQLSLPLSIAVRAEAGSNKDLAVAVRTATAQLKEKEKAAKAANYTGGTEAEVKAAQNLVNHYKELQNENKQAADTAKKYAASTKESADADDAAAKAAKANAKAKKEADKDWASSVQDSYQQAGADISDFTKNGKFDLAAYTKATEANAKALVDYQKNMADAEGILAKSGHDKAIKYLEALGPDAAPLIAAFVKAPASQQGALEKIWDQLGGAGGSSFNKGLQSQLNSGIPTKLVKLRVDDSDLLRIQREGVTVPARLSANGVYTPGGKLVP